MKKFFICSLLLVLLCSSVFMGGCNENQIDDFTTSLNKTNEVKDTENTTEKEHSASEIYDVQNYYQMWCDGEITADELMSKPGVMDNFIERIKRFTGYDLYNENFIWTYVAAEDRYPFKFTITYEDGMKAKSIEAIVIRYKDGEDIKYSVEVNPNIISYLSDSESYLNIYQGILNNKTLLFDTNTKEKVFLCDYLNNAGLSKSKYSIIDLNGDDNAEMVIRLTRETNEYWGFLILHNNTDDVYAYELAYRTFNELKYDGTFMYSSSVSDYGIGKLDFIDDTYTIIPIAYSESADDYQKISYYLENRSVSKEEFDAYVTEQSKKKPITWNDIPLDNLLKNQNVIILPGEDDFSNPDFVIEKGVLVKYLGEGAVVSVPDTVGEIGEYAFSHSSSPEGITEIRLGKNVGKISSKAFFGLDNLVRIDVSSNGYFYYSDNILKPKYSMVDLCGLSYFFISEDNYFDFGMFYENELAENPQIAGMDKSGFFTFKEAVFTIDFFGHDGGLCKIPYAVIFGRYMEFLTHDYGGHLRIPCCAPTAGNYMILADDVYIFTDLFYGEFGSTWCISENGIYENHSADYGTILRFSLNDEGTLCYVHYAGKYYHPVYVFDVLAYCVSRDEFCCEYGTVNFSDEGPIFTPESTFTAEEKYDLEKNFNDWCNAVWEKNLTSLDELIAQNAKKYEKYNPDIIKKKFKKI